MGRFALITDPQGRVIGRVQLDVPGVDEHDLIEEVLDAAVAEGLLRPEDRAYCTVSVVPDEDDLE